MPFVGEGREALPFHQDAVTGVAHDAAFTLLTHPFSTILSAAAAPCFTRPFR